MKLNFLIGALSLLFIQSTAIEIQAGTSPERSINAEPDVIVWVGPAYYNGVWFANEFDFQYWRRQHYRDTYYDNGPQFYFGVYGSDGYYWRDGRRHHGGRHHGGHHRGGHGGGGHHGGGHRR